MRDDANQRVDITIGGQPFTSYIYPTTVKKPVLFPLRTAQGTIITRGFPPGPGERADHPHHVGLWFDYSNVNGYDFWNNSDAIKPEDRPKYGTIFERAIVATKSGDDKGELETKSDWVIPDGTTLLKQDTKYVFRGGDGFRSVDLIATLEAQDKVVVFGDNKDGLIGLRVRRELEQGRDVLQDLPCGNLKLSLVHRHTTARFFTWPLCRYPVFSCPLGKYPL